MRSYVHSTKYISELHPPTGECSSPLLGGSSIDRMTERVRTIGNFYSKNCQKRMSLPIGRLTLKRRNF
jgi:hypothetical protein